MDNRGRHGALLVLWSRHGDPVAAAAVQDVFREFQTLLAHVIAIVVDAWRREPRPPWDLESITVLLIATFEGLQIRAASTPDDVPRRLVTNAITALLAEVTQPVSIDGVPLANPALVDDLTTDRLLEASVTDPADRIVRDFGDLVRLALTVWNNLSVTLRRELEADLVDQGGIHTRELIDRHVLRLARRAASRRRLTEALVASWTAASLGGGTSRRANDPRILAPVARLVEPILERGLERDDLDLAPADLPAVAEMITLAVLQRVVHEPAEPPERTAQLVSRVIVRGLVAPTSRRR